MPHPAADGEGLNWERYDTNHVTYQPALMSVDELTGAYDWLCKQLYHPTQMARRGFRAWSRHGMTKARARLVSSFSSDIGYRREFEHRYN